MLTDGSLIGFTPGQTGARLRAHPAIGPGLDQPVPENVLRFEVKNPRIHVHSEIKFESDRAARSTVGW
ncbi:MAG TPA: hypothetical protein VD971_06575 [Phycisphaerales bacterium]|nr:hypothetical protein [Phycisphaerales bacterium]